MLLGWHYTGYYNNAYAMNQYLASRGYVVLAGQLPVAASATGWSSARR